MPQKDHPERIKQLRAKLLEHLEAAHALADDTQEAEVGGLIQQAVDCIRAENLPPYDTRACF
jgi:hypothetical protein